MAMPFGLDGYEPVDTWFFMCDTIWSSCDVNSMQLSGQQSGCNVLGAFWD
jgi:hypothetical protein